MNKWNKEGRNEGRKEKIITVPIIQTSTILDTEKNVYKQIQSLETSDIPHFGSYLAYTPYWAHYKSGTDHLIRVQ